MPKIIPLPGRFPMRFNGVSLLFGMLVFASHVSAQSCSDSLLGLSDSLVVLDRVVLYGSVRRTGVPIPSCALPVLPTFPAASTAMQTVSWGAIGQVDTSFHGAVLVRAGGVLQMKPGEYRLGSLVVEWGGTVRVDTAGQPRGASALPLVVVVQGEFRGMDGFSLQYPGLADSLAASRIGLHVVGAQAVSFGNGASIHAQIVAPGSSVDLGDRSTLWGRVLAKSVRWGWDSRGVFSAQGFVATWARIPHVVIAGPRRFWTKAWNVSVQWMVDGVEQVSETVESLPSEGPHWIVRAMRGGSDSVLAIVDRTAPNVRILTPEEGVMVGQARIAVRWEVDGSLRDEIVDLQEGTNTLVRSWVDSAGNIGTDRRVVILDTREPEVRILEPSDGSATNQPRQVLRWTVDGGEVTSEAVHLTEGANRLIRSALNKAGKVGADTVTVTLDTQAPLVRILSPNDGQVTREGSVEIRWSIDGVEQLPVSASLVPGVNLLARSAKDAVGNIGTAQVRVEYLIDPEVGRAPVPTLVRPGTAPSFRDRMSFLVDGANAIQFDVQDSAISVRKPAVMHGVVVGLDGAPAGGVRVSIADHSGMGWTRTRADGQWDLLVSGDQSLLVRFEKAGWLPVQRMIRCRVEDITSIDTVVLTRLDTHALRIPSRSTTMSVLEGSTSVDSDGSRTAFVIVPAGTGYVVRSSDGTVRMPDVLTLRATEYTVGSRGRAAMPGDLPGGVGYTYALELGADEAGSDDHVIFDQPLHFYLENFLGFPVGMAVPLGWYDRTSGWWMPESSGLVIKILGQEQGRAMVDLNGDDVAEPLSVLLDQGWSEEELSTLGARYPAGTTLWRTLIPHLTPWDCNWSYGLPEDAIDPPPVKLEDYRPVEDKCDKECGSVIGVQDQTLSEEIEIPGTDLVMAYSSQRARGFTGAARIRVPVYAKDVPASVKLVEVSVSVGGVLLRKELTPGAFAGLHDTTVEFRWNGVDVFGQPAGFSRADIGIRYLYPAAYQGVFRFGAPGTGIAVSGGKQRMVVWLDRSRSVVMEGLGADGNEAIGNSSWALSATRLYDEERGKIQMLSGGYESVVDGSPGFPSSENARKLNTDAWFRVGSGFVDESYSSSNFVVLENGDACGFDSTTAILRCQGHGGVYWVDSVQAAERGGRVWPMIGKDPRGGVLVVARINGLFGIYRGDSSLRKWTFVCSATDYDAVKAYLPRGDSVDGMACEDVAFGSLYNIAGGNDGEIYVSSQDYVARINADGRVYRHFWPAPGASSQGFVNAGADSRRAGIRPVLRGMSPLADGSLLLYGQATFNLDYLFKITPDRRMILLEANKNIGDPWYLHPFHERSSDGTPAYTGGGFWQIDGITAMSDGGYCLSGGYWGYDRRIYCRDQYGSLTNLVLAPKDVRPQFSEIATNSGGRFCVQFNRQTTWGGEPGVWCVDPKIDGTNVTRVRRGLQTGQVAGYNRDGLPVEVFDPTLLVPRRTLAYDSLSRVTTVVDRGMDTTSFEYFEDGRMRITAPRSHDGLVTEVQRNQDGLVQSVLLPDGRRHEFEYGDGELLTSYRTPTGILKRYKYSEAGRLLKDSTEGIRAKTMDATWTTLGALSGSAGQDDHAVQVAQVSVHKPTGSVENYWSWSRGDTTFRAQGSKGFAGATMTSSLSGRWEKASHPDGSRVHREFRADPQWGYGIPLVQDSICDRSNHCTLVRRAAGAELASLMNPFSLRVRRDTIGVRYPGEWERVWVSELDIRMRRLRTTDPEGRSEIRQYDSTGDLSLVMRQYRDSVDTLVRYERSSDHREIAIRSKSGRTTLWLGGTGRVDSMRAPDDRVAHYEYDPDGHLTALVDPAGLRTVFQYDPHGRLRALRPPERDAHEFEYGAWGGDSLWLPPSWETMGGTQGVVLDVQGRLESLVRSHAHINYAYDAYDRPVSLELPGARVDLAYDAPYQPSWNAVRTNVLGQRVGLRHAEPSTTSWSETWTGDVSGEVGWMVSPSGRAGRQNIAGLDVDYDWAPSGAIRAAGRASYSLRDRDDALMSFWTPGARTEYLRDSLDRVCGMVTTSGQDTISLESWRFDGAGRIVHREERLGGENVAWDYRYDASGWLVGVDRDGVLWGSYAYDGNGARVSVSEPGRILSAEVEAQDRLVRQGTCSFEYDADGHQSARICGVAVTRTSYDLLGNLLRLELPSGEIVEYMVDARNRRVGRKVNGRLVQGWLYDGQLRPVVELDGSGAVVSRFVYGSRANVPDYMERDGRHYTLLTDHLGSVRAVIEELTGEAVSRLDYDVWGNVTSSVNPGFQPFGFAGGLRDDATGLMRFGARDYDPSTGRWTTRDPIGFNGGSANLYGYVGQDPVNLVDPEGLSPDLNYFPRGTSDWANADAQESEDFFYLVASHGNKDGGLTTLYGRIPPDVLAALIKADDNWVKHPRVVKLLVCKSSRWAQELADQLGITVIATSGYVRMGASGGGGDYGAFVTKNGEETAEWETFNPRGGH